LRSITAVLRNCRKAALHRNSLSDMDKWRFSWLSPLWILTWRSECAQSKRWQHCSYPISISRHQKVSVQVKGLQHGVWPLFSPQPPFCALNLMLFICMELSTASW